MKVSFKYTQEEYERAVWLHYKQRLNPKLDIAVALFSFLFGIFVLVHTQAYVGYGLLLISAVLVGILVLARYIFPKMTFKSSSKYQDQYTIEFLDDEIKFETPSINSQLQWSLYTKALINDEHFLLYYGANVFSVIPRRVFGSEEELGRFEELLEKKLGNKVKKVS